MATIGTLPESSTNFTAIREAANELIKYTSFAASKELLDITSATANNLSKSGYSPESSGICELMLGSTEAIPHANILSLEILLAELDALDLLLADPTAKPTQSGLIFSQNYPYLENTRGPFPATMQSKVASMIYHAASSKVDFASVLSDVSAIFCNLVPPVELSLCVPYFDVKILYPREKSGYSKLSTLRFTGGSPPTPNSLGPLQEGLETKIGYDVAGMEIFCLPQTLVGTRDYINATTQNQERGLEILDPLVPLMTLESANIQQIGVGGSLYAQTKIDLKVVLHDRSRLSDVEVLTSPEIFPSVTFRITYGWSHPDTNKLSGNPYAKMINAMRITQDFSLYTVAVSTRDATSLSLNLSLISQGSLVNKGAKALTGDDRLIPYSAIQTLVKQFAKLKTSSSSTNTGIATWSNVGTTLVASTSSAASNSKFISIPAFYTMYEYIEQIVKDNSVTDVKKIEEFANLLRYFEDYTESVVDSAFQSLFVFENYDKKDTYGNITDPPFYKNLEVTQTPFISSDLISRVDSIASENLKIKNLTAGDQETATIIPLSALIYRLVAKPLLATIPDLDEVRIHCFSFNSACGYMAEENIGNFPIALSDIIEIKEMNETTKEVKSKFNVRTSVETALGILLQLVNNPSSPFYGHTSEILKQEAAAKAYSDATAAGDDAEAAENALNTAVTQSKANVDSVNAKILADKKISLVDTSFVPPRVKSQIEILPSYGRIGAGDSKEKPAGKIARIIIYDERSGSFNKLANLIFSMINSNSIARINGGSDPISSAASFSANAGVQDQVKALFSSLLSSEPVLDSSGKDTGQKMNTYAIKDKVTARQVASTLYPVLNVGTEGSTITNATYNSSPAGDVGSSYFLTAIQGGTMNTVGGKSSSPSLIDDVLIIPSTVTLTMHGNTCISRGQTYYIDFNTGTTLDNSYTVTAVSHSFRSGEFKTTVTLQPTNSASMKSIDRQIQELTLRVKQDAGIQTNPSKPSS